LPQIEIARVKPVDRPPPNLRLSDDRIDLMKDFSLSSGQAIGGAWGIPPRPSTPFDERYGQWWNHIVPGRNKQGLDLHEHRRGDRVTRREFITLLGGAAAATAMALTCLSLASANVRQRLLPKNSPNSAWIDQPYA
jgi:hypothetical protein